MAKRFRIFVIGAWIWLLPVCAWALTQADVPVIYKNIEIIKGKPFVKSGDARLPLIADESTPDYYESQLRGRPEGTVHGFCFCRQCAGYRQGGGGLKLCGVIGLK